MLSESQLAKFEEDGFLVLENFFDPSKLIAEAEKLIADVAETQELSELQKFPFLAEQDYNQKKLDYFLESAHDIKLFMNSSVKEELADIAASNITASDIELAKKRSRIALLRKKGNRFGHALHALNPVFREFTFSEPIKEVIRSLNFEKPLVCQSMYLLKQDFSTTSDCGHQACTYVSVEPPNKLVSMWMALEDMCPSNGSLQFIPGSHKKGLLTQFIRNPNESEFEEGKKLIYTNPSKTFDESEYVDVPLKEGWAILINSLVVHRSACGDKKQSRDVYAFHVYDSNGAIFPKENWMEFSEETFLPLF